MRANTHTSEDKLVWQSFQGLCIDFCLSSHLLLKGSLAKEQPGHFASFYFLLLLNANSQTANQPIAWQRPRERNDGGGERVRVDNENMQSTDTKVT